MRATGRRAGGARQTSGDARADRRTSAAQQAKAATARDLAEEPDDWADPDPEDHLLDADDAPPEESYAELPLDDDELGDGDGLREDLSAGRRRRPAQILLFVGAAGVRQHLVRPPDPARLDEPLVGARLQERHDRLERMAEQLARELSARALTAGSLRELYAELPQWSQADFAVECELTEAEISRDRNTVVALAAGLIPLQLLFWRSELDGLVETLESWPGLDSEWTRDSAREAVAHAERWDPSVDTIRQLVPWLLATRAVPQLAAAARAQLLLQPHRADEVMARYAELLERQPREGGPVLDVRRGLVVRRRAVLGVGGA